MTGSHGCQPAGVRGLGGDEWNLERSFRGDARYDRFSFCSLIEETWIARRNPLYGALIHRIRPSSPSNSPCTRLPTHLTNHGRHRHLRARPAHAAQGRDHRLRVHPRRRRRPQETPQKPHDAVMPQLPHLEAQGPSIHLHLGLYSPNPVLIVICGLSATANGLVRGAYSSAWYVIIMHIHPLYRLLTTPLLVL